MAHGDDDEAEARRTRSFADQNIRLALLLDPGTGGNPDYRIRSSAHITELRTLRERIEA
jgi:hypothetical protein